MKLCSKCKIRQARQGQGYCNECNREYYNEYRKNKTGVYLIFNVKTKSIVYVGSGYVSDRMSEHKRLTVTSTRDYIKANANDIVILKVIYTNDIVVARTIEKMLITYYQPDLDKVSKHFSIDITDNNYGLYMYMLGMILNAINDIIESNNYDDVISIGYEYTIKCKEIIIKI